MSTRRATGWKYPPSRKSWRVVLGVTHPETRGMLARDLRDIGCRVATSPTGIALLEKMSGALIEDDQSRQPALIIADLALAGCSGISVLEGIRSLSWETPFFLLVEDGGQEVSRLAFDLGATRVFQMPRDRDDISTAALTCLLSRSMRRSSSQPLPRRAKRA